MRRFLSCLCRASTRTCDRGGSMSAMLWFAMLCFLGRTSCGTDWVGVLPYAVLPTVCVPIPHRAAAPLARPPWACCASSPCCTRQPTSAWVSASLDSAHCTTTQPCSPACTLHQGMMASSWVCGSVLDVQACQAGQGQQPRPVTNVKPPPPLLPPELQPARLRPPSFHR